jgi:hypothetical protein
MNRRLMEQHIGLGRKIYTQVDHRAIQVKVPT